MPLDTVDRRMLAILQTEGRISNAALAERLHLSPSPCLRRLRALEHDGVISSYRAVLDRAELGPRPDRVRRAEGRRALRAHGRRDQRGGRRRAGGHLGPHRVRRSGLPARGRGRPTCAAYERLLFGTLLRLANVADISSNFALRTVKPAGPLPL